MCEGEGESVCERKRESERESVCVCKRERYRGGERERGMCVYVSDRERGRECVCVRESVREREGVCVCECAVTCVRERETYRDARAPRSRGALGGRASLSGRYNVQTRPSRVQEGFRVHERHACATRRILLQTHPLPPSLEATHECKPEHQPARPPPDVGVRNKHWTL